MMLEFASRRREIEGKCKRDSEERELQEDLQANCGSALKPLHPIKTPPPCCDVPLQALKAKFVWNKTWPNLVCLVVMSKSKRHWLNSSFGPDSPAWWCWPANYPSSWRDSCQTNWLTRRMTDGHAGCLDVWLNIWLAGCLAGWLAGWLESGRERERKKKSQRRERRGEVAHGGKPEFITVNLQRQWWQAERGCGVREKLRVTWILWAPMQIDAVT